jgi:hypothetical protein
MVINLFFNLPEVFEEKKLKREWSYRVRVKDKTAWQPRKIGLGSGNR